MTRSRLQKEFQHEGEHDGKDDRACQVERRKDAQRESATKKDWMAVAFSALEPRHEAPAGDRPGRASRRDAPVAVRQQPKILPPNVRQIASDDGPEEREEIKASN